MKSWFMGLQSRERAFVVTGTVVLMVLALYLLALQPMIDRKSMLQRQLVSQAETIQWLQGLSVAGAPSERRPAGNESLFALVDRTARSTPLAGSLQRVQPEGASIVRVWLENAPFNEVVRWVGTLESSHAARVTAFTAERGNESGRVSARLTIERSQ